MSSGVARGNGRLKMRKPGVDTGFDQVVHVIECRAFLAKRVGNFGVVLPFAEQENLAADLGGHATDRGDMGFLHYQDQVRLTQEAWRDLPGPMFAAVDAVIDQHLGRSRLDRIVDHGTEAGTTDFHATLRQALSQQIFRRRTAADIADTHHQDPFEHLYYPLKTKKKNGYPATRYPCMNSLACPPKQLNSLQDNPPMVTKSPAGL